MPEPGRKDEQDTGVRERRWQETPPGGPPGGPESDRPVKTPGHGEPAEGKPEPRDGDPPKL